VSAIACVVGLGACGGSGGQTRPAKRGPAPGSPVTREQGCDMPVGDRVAHLCDRRRARFLAFCLVVAGAALMLAPMRAAPDAA
jgi:hypothetical protein